MEIYLDELYLVDCSVELLKVRDDFTGKPGEDPYKFVVNGNLRLSEFKTLENIVDKGRLGFRNEFGEFRTFVKEFEIRSNGMFRLVLVEDKDGK